MSKQDIQGKIGMRTKVSLATIGHMPEELDEQRILKWKSSIFEITNKIESYSLRLDSDGREWEFSDGALEEALPENFSGDFLIAIVNVPVEDNWYTRRLTRNRVVFSFHEIKEILKCHDVPLENAVYRLLYAYTLVYKRSGNRIPRNAEEISFTHDETRGCLFDMNANKGDIIFSLDSPTICSDCVERLKRERISNEVIEQCQSEIKKIRKPLFYRISELIKRHPIWALTISLLTGLALNILASFIYDRIR